MRRISEEIVVEVYKMFDEGKNVENIVSELNLSTSSVFRILARSGRSYKKVKEGERKDKWELGYKLYTSGESISNICKKLNIGRKQFREYLSTKDVFVPKDGRMYFFDEDFFEKIDSESKAYWLGFLYADGCVYLRTNPKTGKRKGGYVEITLSIVDKKHLIQFSHHLNSNLPVREKDSKMGANVHKSCRLTISSVKMCEDLIDKGCVERKSSILTFPSSDIVSEELLPHFLRGYIDGDGSLGFKWSKANKKRYSVISLLGTEDFICGMLDKTGWKRNTIRGANKGENDKCKAIEWGAKEDILTILNYLYSNATIYLPRKYDKYREIIADLEG